jgi:hypothetical protein
VRTAALSRKKGDGDSIAEETVRIFRFPNEFCADTRPYWVLLVGFAISIALLVYTLYTRQPERYRGIWRLFTSESRATSIAPDIQMAAYGPPPVYRSIIRAAGNLDAATAVAAMPAWNRTSRAPYPMAPTAECLGITLKDLKDGRKVRQAGGAPRLGVLVAAIPKTSPLYWSGLRKGDLIVSLNRMPTPTVLDFQQALSALDASQGILLDMFRNDKPCYITVDARNISP